MNDWVRLASALLVSAAFVLQSAVIVYYLPRLVRSLEKYFALFAGHQALTDDRATHLTATINAATREVPARTAALVIEGLAEVDRSVPSPPPPPTPTGYREPPTLILRPEPAPRPTGRDPGTEPGSGKFLPALAGSLLVIGLSAWAGPHDRGYAVDAADYLRANDPQRAEVTARRANDPYRLAESLVRQGRLCEVSHALRTCAESDPDAAYWRGVAAKGCGDLAAARTQFAVAERAGDLRAAAQLNRIGRG